jgi:hypothetical protein
MHLSGLFECKEVVPNAYFLDGFDRKGFLIYRDSLEGFFGHLDDIVVDNELFHRESHTELKHTSTVQSVCS